MRYLWGISVALAACYQPTASPGAPCGPNGECPPSLTCHRSLCIVPGSETDDAAIAEDADSDASVSDASDAAPGYVPWILRARANLGVGLESFPAVEAWLARVTKRPAVAGELEPAVA